MRSRSVLYAVMLLTFGTALLLSGCTIIGATVGSSLDPDETETVAEAPSYLHEIEVGKRISLKLRGGVKQTGIFKGFSTPTEARLHELLADTLRHIHNAVLQRGDTVQLLLANDSSYTIRLIGCDRTGVYLSNLSDSQPKYVVYPVIDELRLSDGAVLDASDLRDALKAGKVPPVMTVRLDADGASVSIPLQDIQAVTYESASYSGLYTGLIIGAVVDGLIIWYLLDDEEEPKPPPRTSSSGSNSSKGSMACGCPFIYGWDGDQWQVEGECFSGAVFPTAQREDWMRLEFTEPIDELMKLQVRNLLQEVDYIDQLSLLRIEHDAGNEVHPTEDGRLLACRPVQPISAQDDEGCEILESVRGDKDTWWLATAGPVNNPSRRWMECRFSHCPEADSVTLVVQVQNTDWGAQLHYGFFGLFGDALPAQYDLWNSDATARKSLRDVMLREGMLQVSLWYGERWKTVGHIWEVGLSAFRSVAMRLDVSGIPGDELRIRLEAPAGVWMVAGVGMDASAPQRVNTTRIEAADVVRENGRECRDKLLQKDGDYLTLDTGQWADVEFQVPDDALPPGRSVTWILESTGYYHMKLDTSAPAEAKLLQRIFTEPGYFADHAAGLWRKRMAAQVANYLR